MGGDPAVLESAVDLLQIDDAGKKAAIVAELEQIASNLAQDDVAAGRLKVLTDELDNIEKTADGLAQMLGAYDKNLVDIFWITLGSDACPADWALEYENRTRLRALAKRARTIRDAMVEKYGEDQGGKPLRARLLGTPKRTFVAQLVRVWAERFGPHDLSPDPKRPMFQFVELLSEWATGKKHKGLADDIKYAARTMPNYLQQQDPSYWFKQGQQARSTPIKKG